MTYLKCDCATKYSVPTELAMFPCSFSTNISFLMELALNSADKLSRFCILLVAMPCRDR